MTDGPGSAAPALALHEFASPDAGYDALERGQPVDVLEWAAATVDRLAVATSFQSSGLVILHMLRSIRPDIPVLFLDTGFHFAETMEFRTHIRDLWDLKLVDVRGAHGSPAAQAARYGPELYRTDPERCCFINKVEPLQAALEDFDGWMSGIRRDQSPLRADTPIVEAQMLPSGNEVLKIHPLARWGKDDVQSYLRLHEIPTHPLLENGYRSIGCTPCTRPVSGSDDDRAGRWESFSKTECGIHTFGKGRGGHQTEAEQ
ncbi:MAG: phosphoadenylyl-sulfate reductase [Actinomycetota bacterium]